MGYIEAALDDPEHYELDGFQKNCMIYFKRNVTVCMNFWIILKMDE